MQFFRGKKFICAISYVFCMFVYTAEEKNPKKRKMCANLHGFVLSGDSSAEVTDVHVS